MRSLLLLFLVLFSSLSGAATVHMDGDSATSISGFEFGGVTYNIDFQYGLATEVFDGSNFPMIGMEFFEGQLLAIALADELTAAGAHTVAADDVTTRWVDLPVVFYLNRPSYLSRPIQISENPITPIWYYNGDPVGRANNLPSVFASFTVVPIPGAAFLMLSALISLVFRAQWQRYITSVGS